MANPFDEPNDSFIGKKKQQNGFGIDPVKSYTNNESIEDQVEDYERDIEKYMQKSLASTQRSRQQLESSEQLATQTAMDLLEQREKLERTDRNLDTIHRTTQLTQRSLNSLKSVFGGFFKNKFTKAPKDIDQSAVPPSKSESQLSRVVEQSGSNNASNPFESGSSSGGVGSLSATSRSYIKDTRWEAMDNQIDENLDGMSAQLARLRTMGTALGDEVEDQNRMLDRIQVKAERNDMIVRHQDNQMKNLLGFKTPAAPK